MCRSLPCCWPSCCSGTAPSGPSSCRVMAFMYILTGLGITVGYHRMLTHKAFQASQARRVLLGRSLGSMAVQGPAIAWVADHRKHHAHTDEEGDPHSPHVGQGSGLKGLWFAHVGWLTKTQGSAEFRKYAPGPLRGQGHALDQPQLPRLRRPQPADPVRARLRPARLLAHGRAVDAAVGRLRADVLPAPRDVVDQLRLPLLRPPALRRRGQVDERARGSRSRRSASRGTTTTTRSRARRARASGAGRSTSPRWSSGRWRRSAWSTPSCGSRPSARRRSSPARSRPSPRSRRLSAAAPRAPRERRPAAGRRCGRSRRAPGVTRLARPDPHAAQHLAAAVERHDRDVAVGGAQAQPRDAAARACGRDGAPARPGPRRGSCSCPPSRCSARRRRAAPPRRARRTSVHVTFGSGADLPRGPVAPVGRRPVARRAGVALDAGPLRTGRARGTREADRPRRARWPRRPGRAPSRSPRRRPSRALVTAAAGARTGPATRVALTRQAIVWPDVVARERQVARVGARDRRRARSHS